MWRQHLPVLVAILLVMSAKAELEVTEEFAAQASPVGPGSSSFHRITAGNDGTLVSCGSFDEELTFQGVESLLEVAGAFGPGLNLMCVRFNENGEALWAVPYSYHPMNDTAQPPVGISAVSSVVLGDNNSFYLSGTFQYSFYLPCSADGSMELCTATVPQSGTDVPAIALQGDEQTSPFYAKLSLEDGGAIWAYETVANSTLYGEAVANAGSLFVSGSAVYDELVTVPVVPDGVDVTTVSFLCDMCSFVCSVSPTTGGAEWCHTYPWSLTSMVLGDAGSAIYTSGSMYHVPPHNNTGIALAKLSVEEQGELLWVTERGDDAVEQWTRSGISCYNDCEIVYLFGSYQLNSTVDSSGSFKGFVWAVDEAGNDQWMTTISDDDHMVTLIVGVESANALYAAGTWLDAEQGNFLKTLDYNDGKILQSSELHGDMYIGDIALTEFSLEQAGFGLAGSSFDTHPAAMTCSVDVVPGVDPVYPSATASPMPTPSPLPPATATAQLPSNDYSSSNSTVPIDDGDDGDDGGIDDDDDDDWIWWIIGVLAVCGIIVALVVVVAGGVIYRRRMMVQQAQEDPYDYDMLSKDMFND